MVNSQNMSWKVQPNQCSATEFPQVAEHFARKPNPDYNTRATFSFSGRGDNFLMCSNHLKHKVARVAAALNWA